MTNPWTKVKKDMTTYPNEVVDQAQFKHKPPRVSQKQLIFPTAKRNNGPERKLYSKIHKDIQNRPAKTQN